LDGLEPWKVGKWVRQSPGENEEAMERGEFSTIYVVALSQFVDAPRKIAKM
jgi:hypothetical protein